MWSPLASKRVLEDVDPSWDVLKRHGSTRGDHEEAQRCEDPRWPGVHVALGLRSTAQG
jgi:hypothetical protein